MSGVRWTADELAAHERQRGQQACPSPAQPVKRQKAPKAQSQGDAAVRFQCKALGLPEPFAEYRFHPSRRFAFDWAWPDRLVALEQEGVVYPEPGSGDHRLSGRHVSVTGFKRDVEKYGEAFRLGWRVLRCLPEQVIDGSAMFWLEPVLKAAERTTIGGASGC